MQSVNITLDCEIWVVDTDSLEFSEDSECKSVSGSPPWQIILELGIIILEDFDDFCSHGDVRNSLETSG